MIATLNQRSTISSFKTALRSVNFDSQLIADGYSFADFGERSAIVQTVPLAAFSAYPCTYRNACVGLIFRDERQQGAEWVYRHRALGAPLVFEIGEKTIQTWRIGPTEA